VFQKELYNIIPNVCIQGVERWIICTPLSGNVFVTLATQRSEYHCKALFETSCTVPTFVSRNKNSPIADSGRRSYSIPASYPEAPYLGSGRFSLYSSHTTNIKSTASLPLCLQIIVDAAVILFFATLVTEYKKIIVNNLRIEFFTFTSTDGNSYFYFPSFFVSFFFSFFPLLIPFLSFSLFYSSFLMSFFLSLFSSGSRE
jgi:hypothetical protein